MDDATAAARFRVALELFATGEAIMRQNLRRRYPQASAEEIETKLVQWLQTRPGAETGDAPGKPYLLSTHEPA